MSEILKNKIRQIILKNLENDKFGVSELALEMSLSRSQVLRKIKSLTGKSANEFIREIRLEEALTLIKTSDLTASEIAYKVGFSSPSYFNKCFLDQYGITPREFKRSFETGETDPLTNPIIENKKPAGKKLKWIYAISLVVILFSAFLIVKKPMQQKQETSVQQEASIAVLPLLDLSENRSKEYLSVGLTDAITLELSKIKNLRVISRGSAMLFQNSVKVYSEIAEKLGVDLLLEGSIIYGSDSLRVTVQLINPFPIEKHLWANKYDQKSSNILRLSSEISTQIAREINLIVAPMDAENQQKIINPVAQESYLRGKYLLHKQNPESVKAAINYLKKSIELDSEYAPSYCALAEAYISMNKLFPGNNEEKLNNRLESQIAINYALNKAVEFDGSLAEAYITKGMILRKLTWDWEGMKEMAELGLKLNPNNKDGYMLLSDYYLIKGNYKKAIQQALIAESLDPLNPGLGCLVAERYLYAGKYEESIVQFKKVLELNPGFGFAWDGIGFAYFMVGQPEKAKNSWKELHKIMGNNQMAEYFEQQDFDNSINFIISKFVAGDKLYCSNPPIVAMAHILVHKKEGALEYLELALKYKNEDLPVLILHPVFEELKNEVRFKSVLAQLKISAAL